VTRRERLGLRQRHVAIGVEQADRVVNVVEVDDQFIEGALVMLDLAGNLPTLLDQADSASGTVATVNYTAEGTITATSSRWALGANQRATYRWVVNPGGPGEIVIPATNLAGFALRAKSTTYTGTAVGHLFFRE